MNKPVAWPEKMYGQRSIIGSDVFSEYKIAPHREAIEYIRADLHQPQFTPEQLQSVLDALEANHEWHQENDQYGGYPESTLEELNVEAIAILKGKLE